MEHESEASWHCLASIIINKDTFELGSISHLCSLFCRADNEELSLSENCQMFLRKIVEASKTNSASSGQCLALVALESLLYNIYSRAKKIEGLPVNDSFYGSLSMSQLSVSVSESNAMSDNQQRNSKRLLWQIEALCNSSNFFTQLKQMLSNPYQKEKNIRYVQNLLQLLDQIVRKQKFASEKYLKNKKTLNAQLQRNRPEINYKLVNDVILYNRLNQIMSLLALVGDQELFALTRVYAAAQLSSQRKHFQGAQSSARDIVYNLQKYYVQSFQSSALLFENNLNPIYRLIKAHLACFHMPFFLRFSSIVSMLSSDEYQEDIYNFCKQNQTYLQEPFCQFIDNIPESLLKYLHGLYQLIECVHKSEQTSFSSIAPIKRLLFHSFLMEASLVQGVLDLDENSLQKYETACNHILFLFFPSSLKRIANLPSLQLSLITRLTNCISNRLDRVIINYSSAAQGFAQEDPTFTIEDPMLNHDYIILQSRIKSIEFTPKDMRNFVLCKCPTLFEKDLESPVIVYRRVERNSEDEDEGGGQRKNQKEFSLQQAEKEDVDFVTWISIGGMRDYNRRPNLVRNRSKLAPLTTLSSVKVKQLERLYDDLRRHI